MKQKLLILIITFLLLQNCGYAPIYSNVKSMDYKINIVNLTGDDGMNNILTSQLKKYSGTTSDKILNLKIKTKYDKSILTRNKTGEITNYLIKTKIEFEVVNSSYNEKFVFEDETKTSSMDSNFDLDKYEDTIKNNFINSKIQAFLLKISSI